MINQQRLLLPLFNVRQYLFCANSIVCYSFKTHPNNNTKLADNKTNNNTKSADNKTKTNNTKSKDNKANNTKSANNKKG